jgi:hypothetical protein
MAAKSTKTKRETSETQGREISAEERQERLDRELEDTFPESDPPSVTQPRTAPGGEKTVTATAAAKTQNTDQKTRRNESQAQSKQMQLDGELADSFPASDPPSITHPAIKLGAPEHRRQELKSPNESRSRFYRG